MLPNGIFVIETLSLTPGPQEGGLIQFNVRRRKVLRSGMRNEHSMPNLSKKKKFHLVYHAELNSRITI